MKIVIIGGSGLIGTKVAERLRKRGHEVVQSFRLLVLTLSPAKVSTARSLAQRS